LSTLPHSQIDIPEAGEAAADDRHVALSYLNDAWVEAVRDGLDEDCLVQAALFAALRSLVDAYGEEPCAQFVERLAGKVRAGEYTLVGRAH
jgi:uncharacterized SAM-dependent methyltransferase